MSVVESPSCKRQSVLRLTEVLRPSHSTALARRPVVVPTITSLSVVKQQTPTLPEKKGRQLMVRSIDVQSGRLTPGLSSTQSEDRLYSSLRKGGDPAAGSPTATLLRLRPSHCARLRRLGPLRVPTPTSGAHSFHGVTGGVYKARERIHRGVADPRLLAIPASCRRVADDNPN